jgi:hemolysin activation/secretion protein
MTVSLRLTRKQAATSRTRVAILSSIALLRAVCLRGLLAMAAGVLLLPAVSAAAPTAGSEAPSLDASRIDVSTAVATSDPSLPADLPTFDAGAGEVALDGRIVLAGVRIVGAKSVSSEKLAEVYEPYLATEIGAEELTRIVEGITAAYRDRGLDFASARIAPQDLAGGVVSIDVTEPRIACLSVAANGRATNAYDAYLARSRDEVPLSGATLRRDLLSLGDVPGVANVRATMVETPAGDYCLNIAFDHRKSEQIFGIDSFGSERIGPLRAYGVARFNSLLTIGDEAYLQLVAVPDRPSEFASVSGGLSLPIGAGAARVGINGGISRVEPGTGNGAGSSRNLGVSVGRVLARTRTSGAWLNLGFNLRDSRFDPATAPRRRDRLRSIVASVRAQRSWGEGNSLRADLTVRQGLPVLGATGSADASSRPGANAGYTAIAGDVSVTAALTPRLAFDVGVEGQLALDKLFSSEQFFVGGGRRGHAFDDGAIAGDRGASGFASLTRSFKLSAKKSHWLQLYALGEAGVVGDRGPDVSRALASVAAGARVVAGKLDASAEIAVPVHSDAPYDIDRGPRLRFRVALRS